MQKLVYSFNEGHKEIEKQIGPRGRNLVKMLSLGIPVPFGFTILTPALDNLDEVREEIHNKISELEEVTGKGFGSETSPLLVSVRSGLGFSMPGTLEGILNVGLKDENSKALDKLKSVLGENYSQDAYEQLENAIEKVHKSWDKPEAYFRNMGMEETESSIIIQQMVYGDVDDYSFSAIIHTRNPEEGTNEITGEYKVKATFEDLLRSKDNKGFSSLEKQFPYEAAKIAKMCRILEGFYKNVATIYVVCESGKLYVLKSDVAKMNPAAKLKAAKDMVEEGLISKTDAIMRIMPEDIEDVANDNADAKTILEWADELKNIKVRANVNDAQDAIDAQKLGAQGIGLVRTEHMFDEPAKLTTIRKMILAETSEKRNETIQEILNFHKKDIKGIFEVMQDQPVTIRLLDMPFSYFLPRKDEEIKELATQVHIGYEKLLGILEKLSEENSTLGIRGARLNVIYPEMAIMQTKAIVLAALEVKKEKNIDVMPEILIPMVSNEKEFAFVADVVRNTISEILSEQGAELKCFVGTMIEIPRAAVVADKLAGNAEFFSFGTNDLTQMVYGFSRVDTDVIIKEYVKKGIFKDDPFKTLDLEGVAPLIAMALKKGRAVRENIRSGVCGEHASDPKSIDFFEEIGMGYISCAPKKVPKTRLAVAQAAIRKREK